jgi:hypothetical protein
LRCRSAHCLAHRRRRAQRNVTILFLRRLNLIATDSSEFLQEKFFPPEIHQAGEGSSGPAVVHTGIFEEQLIKTNLW